MSNAAQLAGLDNLLKIFGSFGGLASISATGTISAANVGKAVNVGCASTGQTISLPAASAVPAGGIIYLFNQGQPFTLSRSGADELSADGSVKTTFAIPTGGSVIAMSNGSNAWAIAGPGVLSQQGDMAASKAASGYQKLPSGLIMQWGSVGLVAAAGITYGARPLTYPSGVLQDFAVDAGASGGG